MYLDNLVTAKVDLPSANAAPAKICYAGTRQSMEFYFNVFTYYCGMHVPTSNDRHPLHLDSRGGWLASRHRSYYITLLVKI